MSGYRVGSYVIHKKMQELGSGEVVMVEKGAIRIRFASGERSFAELQADPHLEVTSEAPAAAPEPAARKRAPRKTPATKRAPAKAKSAAAPREVREVAEPAGDDD